MPRPTAECDRTAYQEDRLPCRAATRRRLRAGFGAIFLVTALLLGLARPAHAGGDTLYGALVMATNNDDEDHPAPVPPELKGQAENLASVFGYNTFRVLAQKQQALTTGTEDWLVRGKGFSLKIDTKYPELGGYRLGIELLKEGKILVDAQVKIRQGQPCYIRGPFVGQGQLIILLMVMPETEVPETARK